MNIYEALKQIDWKKKAYMEYKFPNLRFDQTRPLKSEEDFLRLVSRKSMNPFLKWEKTQEYKNLLMLYLDTKVADDMEEIYSIVTDKAKQGDEKSIRIFLTLQKDIQSNSKLAAKTFETNLEVEEESDDDLDID